MGDIGPPVREEPLQVPAPHSGRLHESSHLEHRPSCPWGLRTGPPRCRRTSRPSRVPGSPHPHPSGYPRGSDVVEQSLVVPDLPAPIVGYRLWAASDHGLLLSGAIDPRVWPTERPLEARCACCDTPPCPPRIDDWCRHGGYGSGCGIYAFAEPEQAGGTIGYPGSLGWVIGRVELWGRVFEHERGYRAQYACVSGVLRASGPEVVEKVAALYGVPVLTAELVPEAGRMAYRVREAASSESAGDGAGSVAAQGGLDRGRLAELESASPDWDGPPRPVFWQCQLCGYWESVLEEVLPSRLYRHVSGACGQPRARVLVGGGGRSEAVVHPAAALADRLALIERAGAVLPPILQAR